MEYMVNKALSQAGNYMHGSAGHNQGGGRAPKAADVQVFGKPTPIEGGC